MLPTSPTGDGREPAKYHGAQALRAVAALLVLVSHANAILVMPPVDLQAAAAAALPGWLRPWAASGGAIGADVFFVVSGFMIAMAAGPARGHGQRLPA